MPFSVYGVDIGEIDDEIEQKQEEKEQKEGELEQSQTREYLYLQEGLSISERLVALEQDLGGLKEDVESSSARLEELDVLVKEAADEVAEAESKYEQVSLELYKQSRISIIDVIFSSSGLSDLARQMGFRRYGISAMLEDVRGYRDEFLGISAKHNSLTLEVEQLEESLSQMEDDLIILEGQKAMYEQLASIEASRQQQIVGEMVTLLDEIDQLSAASQAAMEEKIGETESESGGGVGGDRGTSPQVPMGDPGRYDIYRGGEKVASSVSGPIRVVPTTADYFKLIESGGIYRGVLEMRSDSNVFVINELDMELYLRGIGEVPSSWHMEALKTQVVAARSYAAANWNKRLDLGYNLRDDTADQNYVGYGKEIESGGGRWVSAVDRTKGEVLRSDGLLISAYYHSTCGGHTLSSQEVWGGARSYAQPESDWYNNGSWASYDASSPFSYKRWCGGSQDPCTTAEDINNVEMVDLLNAALYLSIDPNSSLRQNNVRRQDLGGFSPSQIIDALGSGNTITDLIGGFVGVQSIYNSGGDSISPDVRKTSILRVTGTSGVRDISAGVFWVVFNSRAPGSAHIFYSNFWTVVKEAGSWNFYARGYGHRVGMCQYGAKGRAEIGGQSYQQILSHYYRGTNISGYSPPSAIRIGLTRLWRVDTRFSSNGAFDIYANGKKVVSGNSGLTWNVTKL